MKPVVLSPGIGDYRPTAKLYYGQDVRETLRTLPEASVHTVCTSPPYWGLRDYGHDGQIGLEKTPEEYVAAMVDVFREVRRVLREDGTLWLNLGDSYDRGGSGGKNASALNGNTSIGRTKVQTGLKPKDLIGIPWRVAFALQADGWYLRQDIIWAKNNPMPESVTDRCTKAHEYVFLFAHPDSGGKYFYDNEAVRDAVQAYRERNDRVGGSKYVKGVKDSDGGIYTGGHTRNRRSVWNVNPRPYEGAHFAVWPPELVRPMIRAGTSEHGVCPDCGSPWTRKVETSGGRDWRKDKMVSKGIPGERSGEGANKRGQSTSPLNNVKTRTITGWQPSCSCSNSGPPAHATVLDPFSGSATTGMVALQEGRDYIGIDLNPDYLPLAVSRIQDLPAPKQAVDDESDEPSIFDFFRD